MFGGLPKQCWGRPMAFYTVREKSVLLVLDKVLQVMQNCFHSCDNCRGFADGAGYAFPLNALWQRFAGVVAHPCLFQPSKQYLIGLIDRP